MLGEHLYLAPGVQTSYDGALAIVRTRHYDEDVVDRTRTLRPTCLQPVTYAKQPPSMRAAAPDSEASIYISVQEIRLLSNNLRVQGLKLKPTSVGGTENVERLQRRTLGYELERLIGAGRSGFCQ